MWRKFLFVGPGLVILITVPVELLIMCVSAFNCCTFCVSVSRFSTLYVQYTNVVASDHSSAFIQPAAGCLYDDIINCETTPCLSHCSVTAVPLCCVRFQT